MFGFGHGDLVGYVRERGDRAAVTVPLARLRDTGGLAVADALLAAPAGSVVAPDTETDADVDLVHVGLRAARERGGRVVVRCAAPLAARCAGVASTRVLPRPLADGGPVLVVCGSHTSGATAQLAELHRHYATHRPGRRHRRRARGQRGGRAAPWSPERRAALPTAASR